jgi:hypothetical protein
VCVCVCVVVGVLPLVSWCSMNWSSRMWLTEKDDGTQGKIRTRTGSLFSRYCSFVFHKKDIRNNTDVDGKSRWFSVKLSRGAARLT